MDNQIFCCPTSSSSARNFKHPPHETWPRLGNEDGHEIQPDIFVGRIGRDWIHPSGSKPSPKLMSWCLGEPFKYLSFWFGEWWSTTPKPHHLKFGEPGSLGKWRDPNFLASFRISWICNHRVFCETPWPFKIPRKSWVRHLPFQPFWSVSSGHVKSLTHHPQRGHREWPGIYGCFQK